MEFNLTIGNVDVPGDDDDDDGGRQARICLVSAVGGTASIGSLVKPCLPCLWGCLASRLGKRTLTGPKEWDLCGLSIIMENEGALF